jgi:hypothetical protein
MRHVMRTLTQSLRGGNTLQQKHLSALADALCSEVALECWSQKHRDLSEEVIHLLIARFPDCPRWASRAVDQLTFAMGDS